MHNKSQGILCDAQIYRFAANPGNLRKGSLIFWQLGPPNLIPGLAHLPPGSQKLFLNSILARKAARSGSPAQKHLRIGGSSGRRSRSVGHNFASRTGDQDRNWDGDFMLRKNLASSRSVRVGVFGLLTLTAAVIFTSDSAEARRYYRHRHYVHHHQSEEAESYSPQFSSIIVDGNSGATLSATSPDGSRHPA